MIANKPLLVDYAEQETNDGGTAKDQTPARSSCRFFTAMAENKAEKKKQGSSMYFYALI